MTYSETKECKLYCALRNCLRSDLQFEFGFSAPEAGEILNWFDPASEEYLDHVDAWQRLLCSGASPTPSKFARKNAFGSYDIFDKHPILVGAIHQIAKLVYKFHGSPRRETDMEEVKTRLSQPLPITLGQYQIDGIRDCLKDIRPTDLNCVIGRFGPGATCEGFSSVEKWRRCGKIPNVPPSLYRVNSRDPWSPSVIDELGCTKIAEVPKSIKCNRIVSSEPAMRMFSQLAVADDLSDQLHRVFAGHVSLHDAEQHNEFLLRRGACSIDLSDASDHVSVDLVELLLPQLWPVLARVRSQEARFPDGTAVRLRTLAPMGSGITFPVLTLVNLAISEFVKRELIADGVDPRLLWYHWYGDDGIVPLIMYDPVVELQTACGLLVNRAKSCCTGVYRESCGKELFEDYNITPVYLRDLPEECDASKIEGVCSKLHDRGFVRTAAQIAILSGAIRSTRWNSNLQRLEVCVRATSAKAKISSLPGWDGLMRWFAVHTQQEVSRISLKAENHQGIREEVWTRHAWRYKASYDYPYLTTWLVTKGQTLKPDDATVVNKPFAT